MRARAVAVYEPRDHEITGSLDQVAMVLRVALAQGRLLTDPDLVNDSLRTLPDGRVSVRACLLTAKPPAKPASFRWARALAIGVAVAAALLGLWLAVVYAVRSAWHHLAAVAGGRVVVGLVVALAVLWLARSAMSGHACRGIHCDGCSRH